jgi:uncharacterized protein YdaU (DUF1376 family)
LSDEAFLGLLAWDVERWFQSDTHLSRTLEEQGAYLNLCFRAYQRQPTCALPDDDSLLWRASGCESPEQWQRIRERVLGSGGWTCDGSKWTHPTVCETHAIARDRHSRAVRSGRTAGRASARVRREMTKNGWSTKGQPTVDQSSTIGQPKVNPPSPSPSPSPSPLTDSKEPSQVVDDGRPSGRAFSEPPASKEKPERPVEVFAALFNAVFSRRVALPETVAQRAEKRVRAREMKWPALVALPLLVEAQGLTPDMRKSLDLGMLIRDGNHARTLRDGTTCGATDWYTRAWLRADRTTLDARLTDLARQADARVPGVLDALKRGHVTLTEPEEQCGE